MGMGVSHRGGPVTLAVVLEALKYYEGRLSALGAKEVADAWPRNREAPVFWRVDQQASKFAADSLDRQRSMEQMTAEKDLEYQKTIQARPKLLVPQDFVPTVQKGIRAYLDPKADALSIVFTQNGSKDEWRDLGHYTKTSHIDVWPGVHVTICEILQNVQWIVKSGGGDFEITDECEYCDDYGENREKLRVQKAESPYDWGYFPPRGLGRGP